VCGSVPERGQRFTDNLCDDCRKIVRNEWPHDPVASDVIITPHMSAEMTVANALADKFVTEEHWNHMAGIVLGITVPGDRKPVPAHGRIRKIRLLVRERPARGDLPGGFGY